MTLFESSKVSQCIPIGFAHGQNNFALKSLEALGSSQDARPLAQQWAKLCAEATLALGLLHGYSLRMSCTERVVVSTNRSGCLILKSRVHEENMKQQTMKYKTGHKGYGILYIYMYCMCFPR